MEISALGLQLNDTAHACRLAIDQCYPEDSNTGTLTESSSAGLPPLKCGSSTIGKCCTERAKSSLYIFAGFVCACACACMHQCGGDASNQNSVGITWV